jgi:hypothetical protein
LKARLPPLLKTHPLLETLSVHVTEIDPAGGGSYLGELTSHGEPVAKGARRVRGATCAEVLDALSFIAALGLERAAARADAASNVGASHGAPAGTAVLESNSPASPVRPSPALGVDAPMASGEHAGSRQRMRLGMVGFSLLQTALSPARPLALGAALRFAWSAPVWQPLFLLGGYSSLPERRRLAGGGQVAFEHWSMYGVACAWRWPATAAYAIRPCLEVDVGRSMGEGDGVPRATRRSAPWLSGGVQLRAELTLWDRLELGASLAGVAPFWHADFVLLPDRRAFATPSLGLRAGTSLGLLF